MKDEKENVFSRNLNNLDDADVEKISATVPALDKQAKKRILEKCMSRISETDFESEITVSGTEKYSRPHIMCYISTAAACLLAVIGIGGMILVNRNVIPPNDVPSTPQYTAIPILSATTDKTVSSAESTVINTITTAVETTEKATSEVITVPSTEFSMTEQVTEPITESVTEPLAEPMTEIPTEQVTEPPTEIPTTEEVTEPPAENDLFVGKYGDKIEIDYGTGSDIIITKNDDNSYDIYIGFFRVAGFEITGSVNDDGILIFTTQNRPEIYGEQIFAGEIIPNEEGCMLKITESTFAIQAYSDYKQYYRITE